MLVPMIRLTTPFHQLTSFVLILQTVSISLTVQSTPVGLTVMHALPTLYALLVKTPSNSIRLLSSANAILLTSPIPILVTVPTVLISFPDVLSV